MRTPAGARNRSQPSIPGRLLSVFIFLFFAAMILYSLFHLPLFGVREINIEGNVCLQSEELVRLSGIMLGTNIFLIDEGQIKKRMLIHPLIDRVDLERRLPNKAHLYIYERTPFALLAAPEGGFIAIDLEGVYLTRVGNMIEINRPVITGCLVPTNVLPGQALEIAGLEQFLPIMGKTSEAVQLAISEINLSQPEMIRIYTLNGIEIRVGTIGHLKDYLEVFEEILLVQLAQFNEQTIEYVDMSFRGSPVIKFYAK